MKNRRAYTLTMVLLLTGNVVQSQTPFWQQTALDSGNVSRLATNAQGDIFATVDTYPTYRLCRSTDNGETWERLNFLPDQFVWHVLAVPDNSMSRDRLYAAVERFGDTTNSGIYCSLDNGDTWQKRSSIRFVKGLITPDSGRLFLAGRETVPDGGVYRSNDSCRTWTRLTPTVSGYTDVAYLSITRQRSILAGALDCGSPCVAVIHSADAGQTWTRHQTWSPPGGQAQGFLIPKGDIFLVANDDGVNRSPYDGTVWYSANNGIPPWAAQHMAAIAMDSSEVTMYASERFWGPTNNGGVFRSTDNGESWVQWNSGLPNVGTYSLVVNSHGHIFAGVGFYAGGTRGGVFRSVDPVTGAPHSKEALPEAFSLTQNYPNPFNPKTEIVYRVKSREFVELHVFDLLGRKVATLVNEAKEPGEHTVEWDATGLASGVYFYRLKARTYTDTKRLVLMR